jgi:hypothetical protein
MSRRASSGISPALLIGAIVVVAAAFFGGKALLTKKAKGFEGLPALSIEDYKQRGGNALRNNEYVVEGTVDEQRVNDAGRVIFLKVKSSGADEFIPVKIPTDLSVQNIEREQRYSFKVRIEKQGIPVAVAVTHL